MNRTRYLPPGSMRAQRRRGRIEGSVGTLAVLAMLGAAVIAATPAELYRPAHASPAPLRGPALHLARTPLSPCTDMQAKDCVAAADTTPRPIPEPGTLALVGAAAAGLMAKRARP